MSIDENKGKQDNTNQATRRHIIKGLASIPAMATLASGAALANDSSLRCRNIDPPDIGPGQECIDSTTTTLYDSGVQIPGTGSNFEQLDLGHALRARPVSTPNDSCLVYINESGEWGFSDSKPTGGIPVTASCYTSFTV